MYQENHYKKGQEKPISQKVVNHQNLSRQVTQLFFVLFIETTQLFRATSAATRTTTATSGRPARTSTATANSSAEVGPSIVPIKSYFAISNEVSYNALGMDEWTSPRST